ncbi:DUF2798 domain-containing protein [Photobacterium proteolyticum]|uniref:DUF2798 domain-containing protein n=1 Tax=Photobacterium proteolyticum TaxID=1903952 RepID=UPI0009F97D7B|nr:DUF2798 domain-containing protein [Photobacterium proteolyticum]
MKDKQYWVTALLSSFTMAVIMSGIISASKMGFNLDWLYSWPRSFIVAWPCALILNLTVLPRIRQLSSWICSR